MINKRFIFLLIQLLISSVVFAAKSGDKAPTCIMELLNSQQTLNLENYKNKVVYLDFWASWCAPCKISFPSLDKLHKEINNQDFYVVAINLDENKNDALEFLKQNPVDFTIGHDAEGKCPLSYDVIAMPTSYIIDKKGIIREVHLGFDKETINTIRTTVITLLAE